MSSFRGQLVNSHFQRKKTHKHQERERERWLKHNQTVGELNIG